MVAEREIPAKQCTRTQPLQAFAFSAWVKVRESHGQPCSAVKSCFEYLLSAFHLTTQSTSHLLTAISSQCSFKEVGEDNFPTTYIQDSDGPKVLIGNLSLTQNACLFSTFHQVFFILFVILITFPEHKSYIMITFLLF